MFPYNYNMVNMNNMNMLPYRQQPPFIMLPYTNTPSYPYISTHVPPPMPPPPPPTMALQIPSICLPRIYYKFDKTFIEQKFNAIFGCSAISHGSCVQRVDIVSRTDTRTGEPYNMAFVHFTSEGVIVTPQIQSFVNELNSNYETRIYYDTPWFWKVRKNLSTNSTTETSEKPVVKHSTPKIVIPPQDMLEVKQARKEQLLQKQKNIEILRSITMKKGAKWGDDDDDDEF